MATRPTRPAKRGRPRGSTSTTAEALGAIRADEMYPLREFMRRMGLGPKGWRTLRDATGVPVRIVGKQRFILGADLLESIRRLPTANDQ